jgi:hypothetical protein
MKGAKLIPHASCKIQIAPMQTSGGTVYNSIVQFLGPSSSETIGTLWTVGDGSFDAAVTKAKRLADKLAALCASETT